ncbi:zinc finger protein 318 [Aulostomus maculatus]
MYRGRPPPRGGYPLPFDGRGPPPPRPYPAPGHRDDRNRPRPPYHPGYHDHGPPDYRRSPPRRRYPSPGPGGHRGGEYWPGPPARESSPSPCRTVPLDHNLVITVGNELTGPSGSTPSRHHDRVPHHHSEYEHGRSRGRSHPHSHSHSPDRRRAKSRCRSKSHSSSPDRSRAKSRCRSKSHSCSPDRSRAKSHGRSKSHSRDQSRNKSPPCSQSCSPDRSRAKSRGRNQSRSPDRSRAKSRGRNQSRSPDRSRAKSRGHNQSRSSDRSRAKSRGRSKSRFQSKSRSRSRSRRRSRGQTHSRAASHARSKSRKRSCSSSSSSCSSDDTRDKSSREFGELQNARRRKELEELLSLPTKSILKRRNDSDDSPSLRSIDSPRAADGSNISHVADQLLLAVKGMEPHMVASILSELRSDPQMVQRASLNTEINEILNMLGPMAASGVAKAHEKVMDDIDDEERFLYGDPDEPKPQTLSEPVAHHGLDMYGDVTEEVLYGDYPPQAYSFPPTAEHHLQAPPTTNEVDTRYASPPAVRPDQNISAHVPNTFPPGTEPLEEGERQALEEYEKIQDLLKTIGLDLGVAEIGKMAARTKERLHGSKPPPKTPTRHRRYSSDSSNGRRGHRRRGRSSSSSSSSSSRSGSHERMASWSSEDSHRKSEAAKSHTDTAQPNRAPPTLKEPLPQTPAPNSIPPHAGVPIPTYPPPQVHNMMAPSYPPPGYSQYGNYLPYMQQQWPPMYPPPSMTLPPPTGTGKFPPILPYKQPFNQQTPQLEVKAVGANSQDAVTGKPTVRDTRVSEEKNNESQKQKVLEEREKLKHERELRMKKKEYLMKELERLRKQQGELLRKKRREKDGHKDPLLQEISRLQEEVMTQISDLRKEHEAAERKRSEIDKVALILGLSPSDRPHRPSKMAGDQGGASQPPPQKKKREPEKSPERQKTTSSSTANKQTFSVPPPVSRASPDKPPTIAPAPLQTLPLEPFEYYDAGNHWCKNCNLTSGSMFDFFTHLHSKLHRKTLDPYDRPWASTPTKIKNMLSEEKLTKPAKGSEFLLPIRGFFCLLCKEFYGDAICAEEHVTTHTHNENYKKQMYENPLYEQRRNLDRQAGLASDTSGKKRKHEDEEKGSKDKEEKNKHKKEKKDKERKKEEDDGLKEEKPKFKKEEEEEMPKLSKKEESPCTNKKGEDGKYKYKEDEKYRYSREEDSRHRYSREEDGKYDTRPRYGLMDDSDKYRIGKYSDSRSKYDRDRGEGDAKADKEASKNPELEKPVLNKQPEPPPKPYDPPKVLCGPSPAMRAKLRKQSLEAGKPAPATTSASFGKFTWKKRENVLAKEAQKIAADFIKDDEAAVKDKPMSAEDSFAKSVAFAKEIAQKLSGQSSVTPPWVSNGGSQGRIRPNLPAPAAVLRKTAMMGKPAPLNTFLSMRSQKSGVQVPPPKYNPIFPTQNNTPEAMHTTLVSKPGIFGPRPAPPVTTSAPPVSTPALPLCSSAPMGSRSAPLVTTIQPVGPRLPPPVSMPTPLHSKPTSPEITLPSSNAAIDKSEQSKMIKIMSDVAAPGVPESEQTQTVFVKPPPFMNMGDAGQRSEKLKSNLAAAKAKDLFDIFYSSGGRSGASSFSKPVTTDDRANGSSSKSPAHSQCKIQAKTLPQPTPEDQTAPPPQPTSSSQSPQTQSSSDIQIESVWSLQPTPVSTPEGALRKTSQTRPKQISTAQSQTPSVHENQPRLVPEVQSNPKSDATSHQDTQPPVIPESPPESSPATQPELMRSPKTRGKATRGRTPPISHPVRQTRSQTRNQTRQQQLQQNQSELEPGPAAGNSDPTASDQKGLDMLDQCSGSHLEDGTPSEDDPKMMEITPETLGLPSDMTSLDFDYDFNFE